MKELVSPTRGAIISSLRAGEQTVKELAQEIGLTENAIRAHLEALQGQGLVSQSGLRTGTRKPHFLYKLTPRAEQMLFTACEPLLSHMLAALAKRLPERDLKSILREAGRQLAVANRLPGAGASKKRRIDHAVALLKELGGKAALEHTDDGTLVIQSASCPWSIVVAKHSEVCLAAESMLSELIGIPVKQHCIRGESPRCSFRLQGTPT